MSDPDLVHHRNEIVTRWEEIEADFIYAAYLLHPKYKGKFAKICKIFKHVYVFFCISISLISFYAMQTQVV